MRSQASGDLAIFLDYITYEYMIDNIIMILMHTLSNPDGSVARKPCNSLSLLLLLTRLPLLPESLLVFILHCCALFVPRDINEVLENCHPLGALGRVTERNIASFTPSKRVVKAFLNSPSTVRAFGWCCHPLKCVPS